MLSAVLVLALALDQQITIRVGDRPDSSQRPRVLADTIDPARANRRARRRIPVTPELEASAFRDAAARALLEKARVARMRQDSALVSYDATARQRISAGIGVRAVARNRLLFRSENVSRVRWSRDHGTWIDLKGARTVSPVVKDTDGEPDIYENSPIPYYPGREALWIGSGVAKAEVDPEEMIHPLAIGAEAYYRYATGDSITFRLSDGKTIALRELRVEPRRPNWRLSVGSFWFDVSSGQLVRAAYRMATEMDIWQVAEEDGDDDVPGAVKAIMSPMRASLEAVTIDYGLYGGRFWLPRVQAAEGSAQVGFVRVPMKMEESFSYASVNGTDSLPPVSPVPKSLRDSLLADSVKMRDLSRDERRERARRLAEADSIDRERQRASRKAQCDSSGTYVRYDNRHNGTVRTAVRVPCDSTALVRSPDLPASVYDASEELFGQAERDELLKSLGFSLQPGWAPQKPTIRYGLGLTRYNRVEGLSTGVSVGTELGRGFRAAVVPRFSFADAQLNGDLNLARSNGRQDLRVGIYRRLVAANDWGDPLGLGASVNAFLFGLDEGFYYRAWGGELAGSNPTGGGLTWRLFLEREWNAPRETQFSIAHALNDVRFIENVEARRGTVGGVSARYTHTYGLDPLGWRLLTDLRAEAATGTFDYTRGAADLTLSRGLWRALIGAVTASAGTSGGALPPQRFWFLGSTHTVRGQRPSLTLPGQSGNSYWLGRAELGWQFPLVRPSVFGDLGWAGDRGAWSHPGLPASGAGVGLSFLDGVFRVDVARGIHPRKRTLVDAYLEARF